MRREFYSAKPKLVQKFEGYQECGDYPFLEVPAFQELVMHYITDRDYNQAIEAAEVGMMFHPYSDAIQKDLVCLLLKINRISKAIDILQKALSLSPNNIELLLLEIQVNALLQKTSKAWQSLQRIKAIVPEELAAEFHFTEGLIHQFEENQTKAVSSFLTTALLDPYHEDALKRVWDYFLDEKDYDSAITFFNEILNTAAYSSKAWFLLGHAYVKAGDYPKALEAYEFACLSNPKLIKAYEERASLFFDLKQFSAAAKVYQELIHNFEPCGDWFQKLGLCYLSLGKLNLAHSYLFYAVQLNPEDEDLFIAIAQLEIRQKNWCKALEYLDSALEFEPNETKILTLMAHCHEHLHDLKQAQECLFEAVTIEPENIGLWVQVSKFLHKNKSIDFTLDFLSNQFEIYSSTETGFVYVSYLFLANERDKAMTCLTNLLSKGDEGIEIVFDLNPNLMHDKELTDLLYSCGKSF